MKNARHSSRESNKKIAASKDAPVVKRSLGPILQALRSELRARGCEPHPAAGSRFFSAHAEGMLLGINTATLRKVAANQLAQSTPALSKREVFELAEKLLQERTNDASVVAFTMVRKYRRHFRESDLAVFDRWLKRYVLNWGMCDDIGISLLGEFFFRYPERLSRLESWARSSKTWVKRCASVSLVYSLRRGQGLSLAFTLAGILLQDPEDLVQKGYGWMLKEATRKFPVEVFQFVMKHRAEMPRTALRYAIEKLPPAKKREAMKR